VLLAWIPLFWDEMLVGDLLARVKRREISPAECGERIYQIHHQRVMRETLRPEPQQLNPKRHPEPRTEMEWKRLLVRAHRHVRGTRWAADLNPDWTWDLQQFAEAEEFITKAESQGYSLSKRGLLLIDKEFKTRLARGPRGDHEHYGARWGRPERYAVRIVKQSGRWWRGRYKANKSTTTQEQSSTTSGLTELEEYIISLRWGISPQCPRCSHTEATRIKTRRTWKCGACKYQFNIWTGTQFQGARINENVTFDVLRCGPAGSIREFRLLGLSKFQAMRMRRILREPDALLEQMMLYWPPAPR
jgi:transposase-like protein